MVNEEHKTIAKGTFWGLAGNMSLKLVSLVYLIIVARLFTQEDVGTFYLALSILGIVMMFSDLGLSAAFSRYVPFFCGRGENNKAYLLLKSSYLYSGSISFILAVAFFAFAGWFSESFSNPALSAPIQLLSAYVLANTFFVLNLFFLAGRKRMKEYNMLSSLQNVLKLLLTIVLFFAAGSSINALALAFVLSFVIVAVASFGYVDKEVKILGIKEEKFTFNEQMGMLKEVVPFGLVISLVVTFWAFITYTDRIMIGYMLPNSAVPIAIYSISSSLAVLVTIFPGAVSSIFFPIISELYGKGKTEEMLAISKTALRWILLLMVPITLVLIAFPDKILLMFYGASYVSGAAVLSIFSIGLFIRSLSNVQSSILAAYRIVKIELYIAASAAIVNVILNWFLIPSYGIDGAAIASAVSFTIVTILMTYYSWKLFGFGFPRDSYKPVIAGILALIAIFAVKGLVLGAMDQVPTLAGLGTSIQALIIQKMFKLSILGFLFLFACVVYLLVLVLLKSFKHEDTELISAALKKVNTPNRLVLFTERIMIWGREQ